MSSENGSMGIVGNVPRGTPTQRMPINHRPVGTGVSLNVRCLRSCTTRQQGHYPGSGSAPPPGPVSDPSLMVGGMPNERCSLIVANDLTYHHVWFMKAHLLDNPSLQPFLQDQSDPLPWDTPAAVTVALEKTTSYQR